MTTQANNTANESSQVNSSGVLKIAGGGTGIGSPGAAGNVLTSTGSAWASQGSPVNGRLLNIQYFFNTTPGSATIYDYIPTTATGYIIVRMVGGGGGGGSSNLYSGSSGSSSYLYNTTLSAYIMIAGGGNGGLGAGYYNAAGSNGGSAAGGNLNINGGNGQPPISMDAITGMLVSGGTGGASYFGGAGGAFAGTFDGNPGKPNSGGGGSGASYCLITYQGGGGGGAGAYSYKKITANFSTLQVGVGGGGSGGIKFFPVDTQGGAGGSGIVIIEEYS